MMLALGPCRCCGLWTVLGDLRTMSHPSLPVTLNVELVQNIYGNSIFTKDLRRFVSSTYHRTQLLYNFSIVVPFILLATGDQILCINYIVIYLKIMLKTCGP